MSVKVRRALALKLFGVTLETLEGVPPRALKFARGVGTNTAIRAMMQRRGMTPSVVELFWGLLRATGGLVAPNTVVESLDPDVAQAIEVVDPHDEEMIEIIDATLGVRYPEQASFLLEGITAGTGMAAVLNVDTLLTRLNTLEAGDERKATRKKDQAALKVLAERGITPELRKDLAKQVKTATSAPEVAPIDEKALAAADEAYVRALGELRVFYEEWSRIARVAIKRRDYLILLGLAQRKDAEPGEPTPADPAPVG